MKNKYRTSKTNNRKKGKRQHISVNAPSANILSFHTVFGYEGKLSSDECVCVCGGVRKNNKNDCKSIDEPMHNMLVCPTDE